MAVKRNLDDFNQKFKQSKKKNTVKNFRTTSKGVLKTLGLYKRKTHTHTHEDACLLFTENLHESALKNCVKSGSVHLKKLCCTQCGVEQSLHIKSHKIKNSLISLKDYTEIALQILFERSHKDRKV